MPHNSDPLNALRKAQRIWPSRRVRETLIGPDPSVPPEIPPRPDLGAPPSDLDNLNIYGRPKWAGPIPAPINYSIGVSPEPGSEYPSVPPRPDLGTVKSESQINIGPYGPGYFHPAEPDWVRDQRPIPNTPFEALTRVKPVAAPAPTTQEEQYPAAPPRPNLGSIGTLPPVNPRDRYGDIPGGGVRAVEGLQNAIGTGLEAKAPYVRPGALSPQGAVDVFKASQPAPFERFSPSKAELYQLAARKDVPMEGGGLEYGVAPGSSEMWGGELAKMLSAEQFATPEAEAARQMEMYKIGGPERAAGIAGQADIEQQREASRGNLAVTQSKGAQAQSFLDMMNQARISGADVSRWSAPGVGSVSYAQDKPVPTGLLTQATAAYNNYVNAKSNAWFGSDADEELAVYKSTLGQALGMDGSIPDAVKPDIMQMLTDPELMELSVNDLDFSDYAYDPNLQAAIVNAIIKVRGK